MDRTTEPNTKPVPGEQRWVDYDEGTACWGTFGVDSGYCYSLDSDEEQARRRLREHENQSR